MKKDFNDAIMKLEDFCKTYKALSMEDKLLFAVLGPNGSDVAATVANEINEPKDPHGGLTDEEFSKYSYFGADDSVRMDPKNDGSLTLKEWEDAIAAHIDPRDFVARTIDGKPVFADKKTIRVNGEEVPVIDDGEIVVFTVRVKNREDFAMVEGRLRHIGYLRDNDVNPLVSVCDESYVVVTADDVQIGVYTPLDMRSFPLKDAIKCYAASVSKCKPAYEWHNIMRVTTYSSMARGKIDLVLRHLEEDGIVEVEEDVCDD